jgi:polyphosphate glucokinase
MAVLGIDFGGSGIKGALIDVEKGQLLGERLRLPTPEGAKPEEVAEVMKQLAEHFQWHGLVGCGFPAVILHGVVQSAANIDSSWVGMDANTLFRNRLAADVHTVNDADAAGVAEMRFGVGRELRRGVVVMLTVGTGIGSALFVDGHLVPNTEFGHLIVDGKDAERRASDAARKRKNLSWEEWAKRFQRYLDVLNSLIWPDVIIVGGGISKEPERFLPYLKSRAKIIPARLQNQAGMIGAAMFALENSLAADAPST